MMLIAETNCARCWATKIANWCRLPLTVPLFDFYGLPGAQSRQTWLIWYCSLNGLLNGCVEVCMKWIPAGTSHFFIFRNMVKKTNPLVRVHIQQYLGSYHHVRTVWSQQKHSRFCSYFVQFHLFSVLFLRKTDSHRKQWWNSAQHFLIA